MVQLLYRTPKAPQLDRTAWQLPATALGVLVSSSIVSTQMLASAFGYNSALGQVLVRVGPITIYQPVAWATWALRYGWNAEGPALSAFHQAYYVMAGGAAGSVIVSAVLRKLAVRGLSRGTEDIHGSAHWATEEEIKASGLLGAGRGVYIGSWIHPETGITHYLRHDGPEHVLAFAPTRSGKGISLVLPTLLSWLGSVLVYDIKGENWALTAGWRASIGQRCLRLEPTAIGRNDRFNPLAEIRIGTDYEVGDAQNVMTMLIDPDGKGRFTYWDKAGKALLTGALLHVCYQARNAGLPSASLGDVLDFLTEVNNTLRESLEAVLNAQHDPTLSRGWTRTAFVEKDDGSTEAVTSPTPTHPSIASAAREMLSKEGTDASGVLSTALSFLDLYRDPIVRRNTSVSDFRISDLMNSEQPASLYIVVPVRDQDRLQPLVRLVINSILRGLMPDLEFENGANKKTYKHRMLALIDEFPTLGKLVIVEKSLSYMAGYGIKAYLIVQSVTQLEAEYGKDEMIFGSCNIRIAFAPNEIRTATLLSKMTGQQTILKASVTINGDPLGLGKQTISQTLQEVGRPLLTEDEFLRLPANVKDKKDPTKVVAPGKMVIFEAGLAPIFGTMILHFKDPTFAERSRMPPPHVARSLAIPLAEVSELRLPTAGDHLTRIISRVGYGSREVE